MGERQIYAGEIDLRDAREHNILALYLVLLQSSPSFALTFGPPPIGRRTHWRHRGSHTAMWSLFLLASLLSRSISTLADSYVAWQFPAEPQDIGIYDEDTTWALGSTMTLNWTTNLESYPIGLWQGQFGGGAIWINTIESTSASSDT